MAIDAEGIGGPPRRLARFAPPALSGARRTLPGDALAGLTLAAIALPGSMGTAQLVGAPAIAGLIAFIVGSVVFALLGGHRTLSVGADSSIAPLLPPLPPEVPSPASPPPDSSPNPATPSSTPRP